MNCCYILLRRLIGDYNFNYMSVLAIIPARGGSKEIKNKNLISLKGKKLIQFTLEESIKSKIIDRIFVSSDSNKILKFAKKFGVSIIKRPRTISLDDSKTFDCVKHLLKYLKKIENYSPKFIIILQPTSPFRSHLHIDDALTKLIKNKKADSLVSCIKVPHHFTPQKLMLIKKNNFLEFDKRIIMRQKIKNYFARNGAAIYIFNYEKVKNNLFGKKVIPYIMDKKSSLDIDDLEDLNIAKELI